MGGYSFRLSLLKRLKFSAGRTHGQLNIEHIQFKQLAIKIMTALAAI